MWKCITPAFHKMVFAEEKEDGRNDRNIILSTSLKL